MQARHVACVARLRPAETCIEKLASIFEHRDLSFTAHSRSLGFFDVGCTMTRVFNFSPGPAVMPLEVLEQAREELLDWRGTGMSVMEMSHRSKEFIAIAEQAEAD